MSFLRVDGRRIDGRNIPKHTWNADLIDFDGPLLSLFKSEEGDDVLYSWLDCTASRNRWCMVPVVRADLRGYLDGLLSLRELFERADWLTVFDMGASARRSAFVKTTFQQLPEEYQPSENSYLTSDIATPAARQLAFDVTDDYLLAWIVSCT